MLRQYSPQRFRYQEIGGRLLHVGTVPIGTVFRSSPDYKPGKDRKLIVEAWFPREIGASRKVNGRYVNGYVANGGHFGNYRLRARHRGHAFELTRDEFIAIACRPCHYCGDPPNQTTNRLHFNGPFVYNGIDRKDSARGYVADNCLPCCGRCNTMKSDLPYGEFLRRVATIYDRIGKYHTFDTAAPIASIAWPPNRRRA